MAKEARLLTVQERMWLRHLLQQLSEVSKIVRDGIVPGNGLNITDEIWAEQWEALKKEMDDYTKKLSSGQGPVAITKYLDHNE
jgi:hypothetical protein